MQTNLPDSLTFPRASAACANHPNLAAGLPTTKCLREQEASKANRALKVYQDLQVPELMANRCDVCAGET